MAHSPFPITPVTNSGFLPTVDGHEIYFEERGHRQGAPLLYLHGGPGSGCNADITSLLDPQHYRIILMDQRGAGRSRPHGSLDANTTQALIADMEHLRRHLQIDRWHLFGGSWGATLGFAAAMMHPQSVSALTLYGLFLGRQREIAALYGPHSVAAAMFPEDYAAFAHPLSRDQQDSPIDAYAELFRNPDQSVRLDALQRWTAFEKAVSRLVPIPEKVAEEMEDSDYVLAHSLIENHYFRNHCFIDADELLRNAADRLAGIPVTLIASRYDQVCPIETANEFVSAVPHTQLVVVDDAGHTWRDPSNTQALLKALNTHSNHLS